MVGDMVYLAAGLRVLLLIAVPTALAACLCAAAASADREKCRRTAKKHRKE